MSNKSICIGTILITGIPASGKSTLGARLRDDLLKVGINNVVFLDGEDIREQLKKEGKHYGYSSAQRKELGAQVARIALEYNRKGVICVVSAIYHLKEARQQIRLAVDNIMEVHLRCPVTVCAQRDYKGNYRKAFQGLYDNFIGVTEPYQESENVELRLDTAALTIKESSRVLLESSLDFIYNRAKKEVLE